VLRVIRKADMFGSSVVGVGKFNPPIVSPDWLERNGLLGRDDAELARQGSSFLVSAQVAQLETPWCTVQVLVNQLSIVSKGAVTDAFKDLVAGIYSLLPQTPMDGLGMNFFGHFKMSSDDAYHKVGDFFTPKQLWDSIFDTDKYNTGLADLTMRVQRGKRTDVPQTNDHLLITLQPSGLIRGGVYLQLNDHRDFTKPDPSRALTSAELAASIIDLEWNKSRQVAENLFDELLSRVPQGTS
jgi:hypothetical protein